MRNALGLRPFGLASAVLVGAAAAGALVGVTPALKPSTSTTATAYSGRLAACRVTDGDTIRCGDERIRLLGIDAPELPGHCRQGRDCAPGDPYASAVSLASAMTGALTIDRVGEDHYGRTLARVAGARGDLSCWQLEHRQAIYKPGWDDGLRIARTCPRAAL